MNDPVIDRYMTTGVEASALTRAELAIVRVGEAFSRWAFFLNKAAGGGTLATQDIYLLHSIRMRGGAQNLSELMMFLNRNDVSTIQYSLRKSEERGLIERVTGNSKREAGYRLTEAGTRVTDRYAELRQEILVALVGEINGLVPALNAAGGALERLTSLYDQSTQAILNRNILGS
jgi:predicted MarR family transcription regulator